jgi:hypothetical protein
LSSERACAGERNGKNHEWNLHNLSVHPATADTNDISPADPAIIVPGFAGPHRAVHGRKCRISVSFACEQSSYPHVYSPMNWKLVSAFTLSTVILTAADVNGRWAGNFTQGAQSIPLYLFLKQDGAKLSGLANKEDDDLNGSPVKGKIEASLLSFEIDEGGNPIKCELQLAGDQLTGPCKSSTIQIKVVVKRAASK